MLLLPPIRKLAYSKTNKAFSLKYRGISIFILLIVFVFLVIDYGEKSERKLAEQKAREKAQKEEQIRKRNIEYFIENRNQIISSLSKSFSLQDYQKVIDESSKYVSSGDKEIKNLNKKASDALLQIKKAEKAAKEKAIRVEKTQELIAKLKNIPDSHYQANKTIYTQLAKLNPDNEQYKSKLEYFVQKIEEQEKQNKLERARKEMERVKRIKRFGEPPKKSSWNDSYLSVKWYLEEKAHDPDSLEIDSCTELYYTEDGWLVGCNYRGRNAFGAIVRQSNWFTIVHDKVVKVHDASAYNP